MWSNYFALPPFKKRNFDIFKGKTRGVCSASKAHSLHPRLSAVLLIYLGLIFGCCRLVFLQVSSTVVYGLWLHSAWKGRGPDVRTRDGLAVGRLHDLCGKRSCSVFGSSVASRCRPRTRPARSIGLLFLDALLELPCRLRPRHFTNYRTLRTEYHPESTDHQEPIPGGRTRSLNHPLADSFFSSGLVRYTDCFITVELWCSSKSVWSGENWP